MNENSNPPALDQDYWSTRYTEGRTGWDIGHASPALIRFVQKNIPQSAAVLIPGAGNSHEAEWLYKNGWKNVHVVDIAEQPLSNMAARVPEFPQAQLIHGNFFDQKGNYDLVLEQTFFCALNPALRPEYVRHMHAILAEGGTLAGLLFNHPLTDKGLPYGGGEEEYRAHFEPFFEVLEMGLCKDSIKPRAGQELFFVVRKKPFK